MKANIKNTKGNSTMKKLVPAAGMLMISASMLATSTFAWFTMSKEVSVNNIQMTATVPETIQISDGFGMNTGTLTAINGTTPDGVGLVKAPANSNESLDWTNSLSISEHYGFAKLIPASSTSGASMFTTFDATGVGKTVLATGQSQAAPNAVTASIATADHGQILTSNGSSIRDGYYMDIPVWFRTSSAGDVNLSVKATVSQKTTGSQENKLYKAARVSVLNGSAMSASDGVIIPFDGSTAQTAAKYYADGKALTATGALGTQGEAPTYGSVDAITQTTKNDSGAWTAGETVVTVPGTGTSLVAGTDYSKGLSTKSSDCTYGEAVCVYLRIWLEGEDEDCWNATAGQDFSINLDFTKAGA